MHLEHEYYRSPISPFFMGVNKNKSNQVSPVFNLEKVGSSNFELEFVADSIEEKNIKVSIVPINCDHMLLWLIETIDNKTSSFSGVISDIDSNNGMWVVEIIDNKYNDECFILSDINNTPLKNTVVKHSFTLKLNPTEKKVFRLEISKI